MLLKVNKAIIHSPNHKSSCKPKTSFEVASFVSLFILDEFVQSLTRKSRGTQSPRRDTKLDPLSFPSQRKPLLIKRKFLFVKYNSPQIHIIMSTPQDEKETAADANTASSSQVKNFWTFRLAQVILFNSNLTILSQYRTLMQMFLLLLKTAPPLLMSLRSPPTPMIQSAIPRLSLSATALTQTPHPAPTTTWTCIQASTSTRTWKMHSKIRLKKCSATSGKEMMKPPRPSLLNCSFGAICPCSIEPTHTL